MGEGEANYVWNVAFCYFLKVESLKCFLVLRKIAAWDNV